MNGLFSKLSSIQKTIKNILLALTEQIHFKSEILTPWVITSILICLVNIVNALSRLSEGQPFPFPFIYQGTSGLLVCLLTPFVFLLVLRYNHKSSSVKKSIIVHIIGTLIFSGIHVFGMVILRKLIIGWLYEYEYIFLSKGFSTLIYEYRKDLITYLLLGIVFYLFPRPSSSSDTKEPVQKKVKALEFKQKGQIFYLEPDEIFYAKSAGNYLEVFTQQKNYLLRMTLKELDEKMNNCRGSMTQVHRSILINPKKIKGVRMTKDGGADVLLESGTSVRASRRFRSNLMDALPSSQS